MAKIFIGGYDLYQKNVKNIETNKSKFYFAVVHKLAELGNEVLCVDCVWGKDKKIPGSLTTRLESFNPDLCIIFNYGFWDLSNYVSCDIVYCDIDSADNVSLPTNYLIRNKIDRCLFLSPDDKENERIKKTFGIEDEKVKKFNLFLENKQETNIETDKEYKVLYIGTNRMGHGYGQYKDFLHTKATAKEKKEAKIVWKEIENDNELTVKEAYNRILSCSNNRLDSNSSKQIVEENLAIEKLKILTSISPFGLTIKGRNWEHESLNYYPEVLDAVESFAVYDINNYAVDCAKAEVVVCLNDGPFAKGSYLRILEAISANTLVVVQKNDLTKNLIKDFGLPFFTDEKSSVKVLKKVLAQKDLTQDIAHNHNVLNAFYNGEDFVKILEDYSQLNLHEEEEKSPIIVSENLLKPVSNIIKSTVATIPKPIVKKDSATTISKVIKKAEKHLALFFGYDNENKYSKKSFKIGKFIIYENLKFSNTEKRIYFLSLPILAIRNAKGNVSVSWLFATQLIEEIKRLNKKISDRKKTKQTVKQNKKKEMAIYSQIRHKIKKGEKVKICLFVSRISCWIFADLYNLLKESQIFDPIIVVKPFMFNGHDAMLEYMDVTYKTLKARGYNIVRGYDELTETFLDVRHVINPDIVFYTKYWLPQFQENFYINKFEDKLTFYTSYCFDIAYHPACMNFELNNKVNRYFMPSEIHKHMAEQVMNNGAKNVHVVGAPKLDVFFDKSYVPKDVWKPQEKKKKRIIWAPHHSDNFPGNLYQFNAFYELTEFMFEMAEKYKDEIQIAFKPHPMLKPYLVNKKWGKESAEAYYQRWAELENGQLETGEFIDLFLTSDAMILDSISFIAEYTATNKPALFTIGSTSRVQLNEFGGVNFKVLYHTDNELKSDIEKFIVDVVINGNDVKADQRAEFIEKFLLPPNGKTAAQNIYDNILDEIQNGDK